MIARASIPITFAFLAIAGCGDETVIEYEPYAGPPAYPNQRPKLPARTGEWGYVSNNGSDTVTVLDLANRTVIATVPVGRDPVGLDGPHHLAVDTAGNTYVALQYPAPVTSPGPHSAHASSTRAGYVVKLASDDLRILGEVRVDPNPGEIVLSQDGSRLVVSHFDLKKALDASLGLDARRATLALIVPNEISSAVIAPKRIPVCLAAHGVALSRPDGAFAYVACYGEDAIAVVDVAKGIVTRVPVADSVGAPGSPAFGPYSAVLSPSGSFVAIGNTEAKETRCFDTASQSMTTLRIATQGAPYFAGWAADGSKLYVPTQAPDALVIADAATGAMDRQRVFDSSTCIRPHEAVFGKDSATVYLVCEGDRVTSSVVLALDSVTLETKAVMQVGAYPDRLAILGGP